MKLHWPTGRPDLFWDRRRYFYHEGQLTDREKRQAKNAVDQMLEADVFKTTILGLHRVFRAEDLPVQMVLLLHDGIWFTCPAERTTVARVKRMIKKIKESFCETFCSSQNESESIGRRSEVNL